MTAFHSLTEHGLSTTAQKLISVFSFFRICHFWSWISKTRFCYIFLA